MVPEPLASSQRQQALMGAYHVDEVAVGTATPVTQHCAAKPLAHADVSLKATYTHANSTNGHPIESSQTVYLVHIHTDTCVFMNVKTCIYMYIHICALYTAMYIMCV